DWDFCQIQLNYMDTNEQAGMKGYKLAEERNIPLVIMEPIKGGSLAQVPDEASQLMKAMDNNASAASYAVRYAASLDNVFMVLSGMSNQEQLEDNIGYMKEFKALNKDEYSMIDKVTEIIKNTIAIPCTKCNYCIAGCPMNIAIPDLFAIYNDLKKFPAIKQGLTERYDNKVKEHGKASECVGCKQCEEHCPQHIHITEWLEEIGNTFES
ncbi:MAG: aldo/keto reductase, partial [Lachnospiraceae bacterium]|nr:aldo/keto reductase [Lachnospiraceae bacterium]